MTIFPLTVFEILLFAGRSVLGPTQRVPGSKRFKFSVKKQKKCSVFIGIAGKMITLQTWGVLNGF